ncbi:MAG TPA: ATP-binding protein, partial [Streptosporangiaceae bacterium]|nr:ATP-binding protein [Streptosporangiaceae bacterium]
MSPGAPSTTLVWGLASVVGVLVVVLVVAWLRVRRSLGGLAVTVRSLTSGDYGVRAPSDGPAQVREVAREVNDLAAESGRLRDVETESRQLRSMAREVGFRIREHLRVEDLLTEARLAIEENLDAEAAYLHVVRDGRIGLPVGHEHDWMLPADFEDCLPPDHLEFAAALLRTQSSLIVQDLNGPDGHRNMAPAVREALSAAGVVSHLYTPFGVDSVLGFIAAERLRAGHPWTAAEVDAVQSIAADLGRGLHHARLYEAENRLVEDLQALDRARLDFFATVSHELRAPLTTIEGYVEMLADGEAGEITPQQTKMLETIDRSSVRLRNLIEDLLTLSKLETGATATVLRPVPLAQVLTEAAEAIAPSADAGDLTLATSLPLGQVVVEADTAQLDRVLSNLLSNAVKYTPPGGRVHLAATTAAHQAVVTVTDTGIGIPERDQKELFTRFYRASNATSRRIPGTGLGLAIVATIIANHHGAINLASTEGTGTTVTIHLPL